MAQPVEEVTASLVREYLSRKGLKKTMVCMDEELPRTDSSINNRTELRRVLHLEVLCKTNKAQEVPLKSMLEIIVKQRMEAIGDSGCSSDQTILSKQHMPVSESNVTPVSHMRVTNILDEKRGAITAVPNYSQPSMKSSSKSEAIFLSNTVFSSEAPQTCFTKSAKQIMNSRSSSDGERDSHHLLFSRESESCSHKTEFPVGKKNFTEIHKNRTSRPLRGMMAGPVATSPQEINKKRQARRLCESIPESKNEGDLTLPTTAQLNNVEVASTKHSTHGALEQEWKQFHTEQKNAQFLNQLTGLTGLNDTGDLEQTVPGLRNSKRSERIQKDLPHFQKNTATTSVDDLQMTTMILDDINAEEELCELSWVPVFSCDPQTPVSSHPIDQDTATALKEVLFGSSMKCFNEEWKAQSFTFSDIPGVRYGIVQKKGGPCGVLASVQACVLQKLLFEETSCQKLQDSNVARSKCLVLAIAEILWRAGEGKTATVAVSSGRQHFIPTGRYKSEGILEMLTFHKVQTFEDLKLLLEQHILQFEHGPSGCILLTISAILSRSVEMVRTDFDVPTNCLIGAHGYCSQELVNLLLCGRAVSNVFNDDIELDSGNGNITLLKGIKQRSDIGLLSLFEHYNICKVGPYLKTPKFPIWVVCSESHFTVLFCTCKELISDWRLEQKFDLYYYDGLANQQEEIRLTILTATLRNHSQEVDSDLIPPLEHCIRTKWKDATVNWNETEPIL
ncbi:hypothetical protein MATL_G00038420 [Megalops atlanticus]|uniref:Ubiquitin carboxyl-terminal hydrolase MINDY n=1 Tax=Megalops atlanticus TaxID=7932 RepID=A0A9D3TCR5_MEGAT|nr:hypothetical protein MATL_G00038420 [Megalops atlanticus]